MNEEFEDAIASLIPTLKRIAFRLRNWSFLDEDDLLQEGVGYLWGEFRGGRLQGKTPSYLLQGCFFHLRNCCRKAQEKLPLDRNDPLENGDGSSPIPGREPALTASEASLTAIVDNVILVARLNAQERNVLILSVEGFTAREIGWRLGVSHVRVLDIRNRLKEKCRDLF